MGQSQGWVGNRVRVLPQQAANNPATAVLPGCYKVQSYKPQSSHNCVQVCSNGRGVYFMLRWVLFVYFAGCVFEAVWGLTEPWRFLCAYRADPVDCSRV